MKLFYTCFFLLLTFNSYQLLAGNEPKSVSARSSALGETSLTLSDAFSVWNNQAAMAFLDDISFGLYTQRSFFLDELSFHAGAITVPTKSGVFGLSVGYYGFDVYNEKKLGLAYSRLLTEKISFGVQLDYLGTSILEYGNANAFTFEGGLLAKINDQLTSAAHVFNPVRIQSGIEGEKIPTTLALGLSYQPGKKVWLGAEAFKDIDQPAQFRGGIEYRVVDALHIRAGVKTNPSIYTFGVGINVKNLRIDLSSQYHSVLGLTPGLSLSYYLVKKSS